MALWLAVSVKRGEHNIVRPISVECKPDKIFMDLLEKVMAQSTSESLPFDVEYVRNFFFAQIFNSSFQNSLSQVNLFPRSSAYFLKSV